MKFIKYLSVVAFLCNSFLVDAQAIINSYISSDTIVRWEDMSDYTPQELIAAVGEDEVYPVTLPFDVQFFNATYTEMFVSINGNVSFGRSYQAGDFNREKLCEPVAWDYDPAREQDALNPDNFIAVFWDDLFLDPNCTVFGTPKLTQRTIGTAPNREFIITYDYFVRSGDLLPCTQDAGYGALLQAQLRIHETTNIIEVHHFKNTLAYTTPELPTVGVENLDGTYANYTLCGTDSFPPQQGAWVFYPSEDEPVDTTTTQVGYCELKPSSPCNFQWINSFECNNVLQNDNTCDKENQGLPLDDGYSNYSELVLEFTPGENTTATITVETNILDQASVFIDWDNSGTWETDEVYPLVGTGFVVGELTGAIVVPEDAVLGTIVKGGVRVIMSFQDPILDACAPVGNGEVEDYSFVVLDPDLIECTTILEPSNGDRNVCDNSNFIWTAQAEASAYNVLIVDSITRDTIDFKQVVENTYSPENLQPNTIYEWQVVSVDSVGRTAIGCAFNSFETTPNASPTITFSPDTLKLCQDEVAMMPTVVTGGNTIRFIDWGGDNSYLDFQNITNPLFTASDFGQFKLGLYVDDSLNCFTRDSIVVVVNEKPVLLSFNLSSTVICPGDSLGVTIQTNDATQFFSEANSIFTSTVPSSIANGVIYFNEMDTVINYHIVLTKGMCSDTILLDTVHYVEAPVSPIISFVSPAVGPCEGDSVLFVASNYSDNLQWFDGTNNDSVYVKANANVYVDYLFEQGVCKSPSDTLTIEFDALPSKPIITPANASFCEGDSVLLSHNASGSFEWSNGDVSNTSLYFSASSDVYVVAKTLSGCATSSDTINIVSNPNPNVPMITFNGILPELCEGQVVTASTNSTDNLKWSTGETTMSIDLDANSEVFVIAVNGFGCETSSDTTSLVFAPRPNTPTVLKIEGNVMDSLKCSVAGSAYKWFFEGQSLAFTSQTIPLENEGLYRVNVTGANGCISALSQSFTNVGIIDLQAAGIQVLTNENHWVIQSEKGLMNSRLIELSGKVISVFPEGNTVVIPKTDYNAMVLFQTELNGKLFTVKLK